MKKRAQDFSSLGRMVVAAASQASGDEAASKSSTNELTAGLYLVGMPIGHSGDITLRGLSVLAQADMILCEDTRVSGALLARYGIRKPLVSFHEHNAVSRTQEALKELRRNKILALISDAGMPLISDPGAQLVTGCIAQDIPVTCVPGASAVLTALSLSGLPALPFYFAGFPPSKSVARKKFFEELKKIPATLVLFESPQRLAASLKELAEILGARDAAVARELTKLYEETRRGPLSQLAAHYEKFGAPKGEIVIVIAPPYADKNPVDVDEIEAELRRALKHDTLRDAVDKIAQKTGQPRRAIYKLALRLTHAQQKE